MENTVRKRTLTERMPVTMRTEESPLCRRTPRTWKPTENMIKYRRRLNLERSIADHRKDGAAVKKRTERKPDKNEEEARRMEPELGPRVRRSYVGLRNIGTCLQGR
jgi:hypothetical protein